MRVFAPYTVPNVRVISSINKYCAQAGIVPEYAWTGKNDFAYWHALSERWTGEEDLVVIEHDNEIAFDTIMQFQDCPEPWCCFWYTGPPLTDVHGTKLTNSLGCTKLSPEAQRAHPIAKHPAKWDVVADHWHKSMLLAGLEPHVHGQVKHHHQFKVIFLPSPSNHYRRYTWEHVDKGEYPSPGKGARFKIPDNAESFIIDGSVLE